VGGTGGKSTDYAVPGKTIEEGGGGLRGVKVPSPGGCTDGEGKGKRFKNRVGSAALHLC